jgi:hypothetical protein
MFGYIMAGGWYRRGPNHNGESWQRKSLYEIGGTILGKNSGWVAQVQKREQLSKIQGMFLQDGQKGVDRTVDSVVDINGVAMLIL